MQNKRKILFCVSLQPFGWKSWNAIETGFWNKKVSSPTNRNVQGKASTLASCLASRDPSGDYPWIDNMTRFIDNSGYDNDIQF
jgi:hypothetical protein